MSTRATAAVRFLRAFAVACLLASASVGDATASDAGMPPPNPYRDDSPPRTPAGEGVIRHDGGVPAPDGDSAPDAAADSLRVDERDGGVPGAVSPAPEPPAEPAPGTEAPEPRPAAPAAREPMPTFVPVPVPSAPPAPSAFGELLHDLIPMVPPGRTASAFSMLLAILVALLAASLVRRARDALPNRGVLPLLLQLVHVLVRLVVLALVIVLLVASLPAWLGPALPWVLLAAAAALGWSARDFLPDLVAGTVILFERRIRRGVWLAGEKFSGTVLGVGLRSTLLADARGHRIAVPNRHLLSGPIVSDRAVGAEHEVTLRMESPWPAGRVRQALMDAVLQSPWVPPGAAPMVLRDPEQPHVWRVRSRLLEARYAPRFEGELLERAEEILAAAPAGTFPLDEELDDA
jgi:hypothetical protein